MSIEIYAQDIKTDLSEFVIIFRKETNMRMLPRPSCWWGWGMFTSGSVLHRGGKRRREL